MPKIKKILETKDVEKYLKSRQLLKKYKKAKNILISGNLKQVYFKLRQPKKDKNYEFYIDNKYRAFGFFDDDDDFIVHKISDHQKN